MSSSSSIGGSSEIRIALQNALEENGVLEKVRADLRAGVFKVLNEDENPSPPKMPEELLLTSELILDFLSVLSYDSSREVFARESGRSAYHQPLGRAYMAQTLGLRLVDDDGRTPLISMIVEMLKIQKGEAADEYVSKQST
jgi:hypothetical protein